MESQMNEKRPLTSADPIDAETLQQFRSLQEARDRIAGNLLSMEQEKIQLLAAAKKVDDQRNRLFQNCLVERGLSPDTDVEIDAKTGKIKFSTTGNPEAAPPPAVAS
jgi:hypothetical protein